jgi:hypothetical protein
MPTTRMLSCEVNILFEVFNLIGARGDMYVSGGARLQISCRVISGVRDDKPVMLVWRSQRETVWGQGRSVIAKSFT